MHVPGAVRPALISEWIDSGVQPCFRVRTRTGRHVDVTGHHPFLTVGGWTPLLDLNMRLGEGTGALLALSILDAAARLLDEMATFDEDGVAGSDDAATGLD